LIKSWTNKYPRNQAPNVTKLVVNDKLAEKNVELMPRQIYVAKVNVTDDNSEKLKYQWELRHETVAQSIGGDIEEIHSQPRCPPGKAFAPQPYHISLCF